MIDTRDDWSSRARLREFATIVNRIKLILLATLLAGVAVLALPGSALAEVGDTGSFMPSQWRGGSVAAPSETSARRGTSRRAAAASTSFDDGSRPQRRSSRPIAAPRTSLSGGGIAWRASSSCLASNLRSVIASVAANYGSVTVNSTCRSHSHNRRVGGASKSWHLTGDAADIRVHGNWRTAAAYLRSSVGGFKHYGGGLFHIDNGPKRGW